MAVATAPVALTPAEVSQTQVLKRLVQLMVKQLVLSGSGQFQQQVMDFQKAWNGYAAIFAKVQPAIATPSDVCANVSGARVRHFTLVEDGQYGPKSATALYYLVGPPRPPCKASGMAAWYVSNHDKIDALTPPTNYPVDVREPAASGAMQQSNVVTDVEIAQAGGTTAQQLVVGGDPITYAPQSGGGTATNEAHAVNQDVVQSIVTEPDVAHALPGAPATKTVTIRDATVTNTVGLIETKIKRLVANGNLPSKELHIIVYGAKLPSLETVLAKLQKDTVAGKIPYLQPAVNVDLREQSVAPPVTQEEIVEEVATPVLSRPRSGRTAAIALAVGGTALLGVLGWMAYGGKRRRR